VSWLKHARAGVEESQEWGYVIGCRREEKGRENNAVMVIGEFAYERC